MYYSFNPFINRIVQSTQEAYYPQGLTPHSRGATVITFDSKMTKAFQEPLPVPQIQPCSSEPSASIDHALGIYPSKPRYQRLMRIQNAFLINDGKLVWQKLGARDRVAYYATLGLVLAGSVMCMRQIYQMIFPEKHSVTDKLED